MNVGSVPTQLDVGEAPPFGRDTEVQPAAHLFGQERLLITGDVAILELKLYPFSSSSTTNLVALLDSETVLGKLQETLEKSIKAHFDATYVATPLRFTPESLVLSTTISTALPSYEDLRMLPKG